MQILVQVCLSFLTVWKTVFTVQLGNRLYIGKNKKLRVGRVVSWAGTKSRNSTIVNDFILLGTWLEWEKQKFYLQTSPPASSYPPGKYPNLSVTRVLCWWGYHQMLVSGGRKHKDAHPCVSTAVSKIEFLGLYYLWKSKLKSEKGDSEIIWSDPNFRVLSVLFGRRNVLRSKSGLILRSAII